MPANAAYQSHTGVAKIDGLFSGVKWDTLNLSYSFPAARSDYEGDYSDPAIRQAYMLHTAQRGAVNKVLTQRSGLTSLPFTEFTGTAASDADLRFALS